jgi:hypothetical protein
MSSRSHYYSEQQSPFGDRPQSSESSGPHQAGGSGSHQQPPAYGAGSGSTGYNRNHKAPHEFWYLGTQIPDPNLPRVGINTQKYPGYDPKVDWERLEAMIEVRPINYTSYDVADPVRGEPYRLLSCVHSVLTALSDSRWLASNVVNIPTRRVE